MDKNALSNPLSSTLGGIGQLKSNAATQNTASNMGGWSSPSLLPLAGNNRFTNDWVDTKYTTIPVELYDRKTGKTVKTYSNVLDYQADTMVVSGGATQKPKFSYGDVIPGLATSVTSRWLIGNQLAPGIGGFVGAATGALSFMTDLWEAQGEARRAFNNDAERTIELLADVDEETGEVAFNPDKIAKANSLSGNYIKNLKSIPEGEPATWNLDGKSINVNVAPAFAESDTYKDYIKQLSGDLAGMTQADDPDGTYIKNINAAIKALQSRYFYDAEQAANYQAKFPNASVEAIQMGIDNETAGYMGSDADLEGYKMMVYENNQLVEKNAVAIFNKLYNNKEDKIANDTYIGELQAALDDPTISQDSKAVIYGQMQAIWAANRNEKLKYHGMINKDWRDYLGENSLVLGLSVNDVAALVSGGQAYGALKYYDDDQLAKTLVGLGTGAVNMYTTMKVMDWTQNAFEAIGTKGLSLLGDKVSDIFGAESALTKSINWLAQTTANKSSIMVTGATTGADMLNKAGAMAVDIGYQALADLTVDAVKAGIQKVAGKDVDMWAEFKQDFAMDLIFTYAHTGALQSAMAQAGLKNMSVADLERVIRDSGKVEYDPQTKTKTIKISFESRPDLEIKIDAENIKKGQTGSGESEIKNLTNDELGKALTSAYYQVNYEASMRAAQFVNKIADNKLALAAYRKWVDSNIDIKLLGYKSLAQTGDATDLIKLSNVSNTRRVFAEKMQDFLSTPEGRKAYDDWKLAGDQFVAKTGHNFTDADSAYLNAKQELSRVTKRHGKGSDQYKRAELLYKGDLSGVDATTALALDEYAKSLVALAKSIGAYEQTQGLQTTNFFDQLQKYPDYFPVYMKPDPNGKVREVEYRRTHRTSEEEDVLLSTSEMLSPEAAMSTYLNNVIANAARAEQIKAILDVAQKVGGIDVTRTTKEARPIDDLPYAALLRKYNVPDAVQKQVEKLADEPDVYNKEINKIIDDSLARQHVAAYATTLARLKNSDVVNANGEAVLKNSKGAYKAGMTRQEVDQTFLDLMENSIASIISGSKTRLNKFKDYVELDSPQTLGRVMAELRSSLDSFSSVDFMTKIAQLTTSLSPMYTRDMLMSGWVTRNSIEYAEEVATDPEVQSGRAAYDISTNQKVKRGGAALNLYTQGRVETYYLKGKTAADQEKADAIVDVLNSGLSQAYKNGFLRVLSNVSQRAAYIKRQANSGTLPQRAVPNKLRDTAQAMQTIGASAILSPRKVFMDLANSGLLTEAELKDLGLVLDRVAAQTRGYTENEVFNELRYGTVESATRLAAAPEAPKPSEQYGLRAGQRTMNQLRYQWDSFKYNVKNIRKGGFWKILQTPGDISEASTRSMVGQNTVMMEFLRRRQMGQDTQTALAGAYEKGAWAARNATTDFSTKGEITQMLARWTPFTYASFSDIASKVEAFVLDPVGVSARTVTYMTAYIYNLASLLSNEDGRRRYMNMSEYERTHNIIIGLGGINTLKIPIDETMAGMLAPFRVFTEILAYQEPVSFWKIFGAFLEPLPIELSGFTEGDRFNLQRGLEKFADAQFPTIATMGYELIAGRDLYYGNDLEVTDADLAIYGTAAESAGDYTTNGKNSKTLRWISDLTNIPQWRLQQVVSTFGGTLGEYVLYTLDKLQGATAENTGGTDVIAAFYKPFVSTTENATNAFYEGLDLLKEEKQTVQNKLMNLYKQSKTASSAELIEIRQQYQDTLDKFVTKTADFINKYLSVYEMTGGLTSSQASNIYYLFDFDVPYAGTNFLAGTAGASAADELRRQNSYLANQLAGQAIGGNYNTNKLYKKSDGTFERETPYGVRGLDYLISNQTAETVAQLKKIGSENNLSNGKYAAQQKISAIYDKGNLTQADYDMIDQIAINWDIQAATALAPYFLQNGTDSLTRSKVIDLLDDYFIVTSDFMVNKKGRYVSSPNLNKQRGFAQAFIKTIMQKIGAN